MKTTVQSQKTADGSSARTVLAIRWIFPEHLAALNPIASGITSLGRDPDCDIFLASDQLSRRHAEIESTQEGILIHDRNSRNGIFVQGARVSAAPLTAGSIVRLADVLGVVVEVPIDSFAGGFATVLPGYFAGPNLMRQLGPVRKAAPSDLPIIVQGETGTGKEGLARAIHLWSGRSGPFVAVNCAAVPEALAEGELFGYRKGSFTGADRANAGHFRSAHGGTLFLDEVLELPASIQPKLLRALEQREVVPLGESTPVPVDVRIVVAAQGPLRKEVEDGRMRKDLFARLDGLTIELPPLRERIDEIPFLFTQILMARAKAPPVPGVDVGLAEQLCLYDWPFNVRELDLLVRQLLALHNDEPVLRRGHLPGRYRTAGTGTIPPVTPGGSGATAIDHSKAESVDPDHALAVLRANHGNVARAAAALRISRQKLYRLLEEKDGVDIEQLRKPPKSD
ncbi:MAG: sigma 54-interacting transcriptional regulator [Deltaproteobacteria bacterium]|nr:sigma 54-interacting transcriptional regulator [Deltaproteobacteria bacterium]